MSKWYRVFAQSEASPTPEIVLEYLHTTGYPLQGVFRKDEQGWFEVSFAYQDRSITLQRFLAIEKGVRAELNAFAAWIEMQDNCPNQSELMEQVISAQQVFAIEISDEQASESAIDQFCQHVIRYLAKETEGLFQIDNAGLYNTTGEHLLSEEES